MTTSTLDCYLSEGNDSIQRQLTESLTKLQSTGEQPPYCVVVSVRYKGESYRTLLREVLHSLEAGQASNVVIAIREALHKGFGHAPEGLEVRTRGYLKGMSGDPDIDCRHTISSADPNAVHPHVAQVVEHNARLMNMTQSCMQGMSTTIASQGTTIAAMAEAQTSLATTRTAGAASADVAGGGFGGLLAIAGLAFAWPMLREAMNVPEGVTLPEMLKLLQHRVKTEIASTMSDVPNSAIQIGPPPPIQSEEPAHQDDGQETTASVDTPPIDLMVQSMKTQPELLQSLIAAVLQDPELKKALVAAYLAAK